MSGIYKSEGSLSPDGKLWFARIACFFQIGCLAQLSVYEAVNMMDNGLSGTMTGILLAISNALIIIISPFWGWIADHYHCYRRLIGWGTVGMSGTLVWFAFSDSTADFLFYAILRGVIMMSVMGIMPALALANVPGDSQGKGFGSYRSFGSIGFMVVTFILPNLLPSISAIALACAVVLPVSLYFVFALDRPEKRSKEDEIAYKKPLPTILYWFLAANFLISLTDPGINGFYNSYASSLGSSLEWIGFISGINGFIAFICLPLMGRWVDRYGAKPLLILGFAAQSLRMLNASIISSPEWLWVPHLFHSFGWAGREVATMVFVTMVVGPTRRATAIMLVVSTKMAGMMVGSFLMGYLSDLYGFPVMFQIIAFFAGCSLLFLLGVFKYSR